MSHRSHSILQLDITRATESVKVSGEYVHYKYPTKRYKVIDVGIQEATEKVCVIYCDTSMPDIHFVRDIDSWLEQITINGQKLPRFTLVS